MKNKHTLTSGFRPTANLPEMPAHLKAELEIINTYIYRFNYLYREIEAYLAVLSVNHSKSVNSHENEIYEGINDANNTLNALAQNIIEDYAEDQQFRDSEPQELLCQN